MSRCSSAAVAACASTAAARPTYLKEVRCILAEVHGDVCLRAAVDGG